MHQALYDVLPGIEVRSNLPFFRAPVPVDGVKPGRPASMMRLHSSLDMKFRMWMIGGLLDMRGNEAGKKQTSLKEPGTRSFVVRCALCTRRGYARGHIFGARIICNDAIHDLLQIQRLGEFFAVVGCRYLARLLIDMRAGHD